MKSMKSKKISLKFKGKRININARVCDGLKKYFGLMFTSREKAVSLLFNFNREGKWGIHSFFVWFNFVVVWLDKKNNIIEARVVKPFTFLIRPKKSFTKLVEIPINKRYEELLKFLSLVEVKKSLNTGLSLVFY